MADFLYSIRMHAHSGGTHLSGAERIVAETDLERTASCLLRRAMTHARGRAERVQITVDALDPEAIGRGTLPDLTTVAVADYLQGRAAALDLLVEAGVAAAAARSAMETLAAGAAPGGGVMRGAMLVDAVSGERLEPDRARGVRVSRMDLTVAAERELRERLQKAGLDNPHVREALVLAGKVLGGPGVVAELCWSDDPDYTAGYVCSAERGYVRFPHLKPVGDPLGGRAFFLRPGLDPQALIDYLERAALLVDEVGAVHGETEREVLP